MTLNALTRALRRRLLQWKHGFVNPDAPKHQGFYLDDGIHVYGDPNMNDATRAALLELVRCATEAIERGEIGRINDGKI